MYNPFPLLTQHLLRHQIVNGLRFFVRQTFPGGMDTRLKAAFLLRAYPASEKEAADRHLAALPRDTNAFLYDAAVPGHLEKLQIAARQPHGFKVFYAAKKGVDWKPPAVYKEKMRHYLRLHHSGWRTTRGGSPIQVGLYEEFGELFLTFSYGDEKQTIPFEDIEKY